MIPSPPRTWYIAVIGNDSQLSEESRVCPHSGLETGWIIAKGKKSRGKQNGAMALLEREKPAVRVRDYDSHVLVCKGSDCKKRGSKEVRKALKGELRAAGMNGDVRVDSVECLGLCKHGPNAIVYPSGTWYLGLIGADAPEIVGKHLKTGEPVEHLAAEFRPRKKTK